MPWGDYGEILLVGMTGHLDRHNGLLQYERTGPFQPDIIISGVNDLLVTNSVKSKIELSDLKGFEFKPVLKQHISQVEWTSWNFLKDEPEFYPDGGEPENYILSLPHSQEIADKMETVWEVIIDENGTLIDRMYSQGDEEIDIMRPKNSLSLIVTERAKDWIEINCTSWLEFLDLEEMFD